MQDQTIQSPAIQTRQATLSDRDEVLRLFKLLLDALGYDPDPVLDADMIDFPVQYSSGSNVFLVAGLPNGRLIGSAGLLAGEVRRVFVEPADRKQGVAHALIEAIVAEARQRGVRRLFALIARENTASRNLFLRSGFVATGRSPDSPLAQHCELFELAQPDLTKTTAP